MTVSLSQRLYWLDALKAIGLFFVLLGHTNGIPPWLRGYIHSFHIPLFFFISGYLVSKNSLASDFSWVLRHHFRSLILPYFTFGLIGYLIWLLFGRFYGRDLLLAVNPYRPLVGMLYGIGVDHWLRHNVALWFLPSLFCLHLLFYWLHRYCNNLGLIYAVILLSLAGVTAITNLPFRLPWGIEPACIGLVFYWAGHTCHHSSMPRVPRRPFWRLLVLSICLTIQIMAIKANIRVDLNSVHLGSLSAFFLAAFSGIIFWCLIALSLPKWQYLSAMAHDSIIIFSLHTLCFSAITFIVKQWLALQFNQNSYLAAGIYTLTGLAMLTAVAPWIRKWLPWLKQ